MLKLLDKALWPEGQQQLTSIPQWLTEALSLPNSGCLTSPESFFVSRTTGLNLHYRTYHPHSNHVVYFFHGLNDHCSKLQYTSLCTKISEELNCTVKAMDMISHGLSQSPGAHEHTKMIISWEALVDDAAQFVEESTHNKGVTFSFLAHSTGGAIALCLHNLLSSRPEYKGLYSIAPLIHPPPIPSFVLCALKTFLLCLPCLCSSSSLLSPPRKTDTEPWLVFSSPEAYRVEAVDDPLQWQGKIPLGTGSVLIDFAKHVTNSVIPELSEKNVRPIKIVHGVEDGLVSVEGSRALTAAVEEAEIWEIEGERHVPLQGNLGEEVEKDIITWLKQNKTLH
ncbi:hypothetical protein TrVE_jg10297 [Triparma verrucosa]|uniref:Serine aminopeptidase S33 domain-containing protein n=1 Tax=Triparma verrucosa TaxID=1606542 RepID=A0A9W7BZ85_9STRA|nr:hypothetical protein TrVE_jg10297 [Triparma verrucosa]